MKAEIKWDAAADRKLLLGILRLHDIKVDNEKMAEYMSTETSRPTASAIQTRLKMLRSMTKAEWVAEDMDATAATAPKKRANPDKDCKTPRKKALTGKKAKHAEAGDVDDDDDGAATGLGEENIVVKGEDDGDIF